MDELRLLITQARNGNLDAFGSIVGRFQDMALAYAYSVIGDFHLAEDAAQEAFIQAYRDIDALREPSAFPGWFRKIVFKHCDRIKRKKHWQSVPLDDALEIVSDKPGPVEIAETHEMREMVLNAISSLPKRERTITTLFYINGYTQKDVAEFLELPVSTINNSLHSSRTRLKERMVQMVNDELKTHALPDDFPERIKALLGLPRPLEIEGHPVQELWKDLQSFFADFEVIELDEIVPKELYPHFPESYAKHTYAVDEQRVLRPELTQQLIDRWSRICRKPCKWITAGRTFRITATETATALEAFHQAEAFWVAENIGEKQLQETVKSCISRLLPGVEPTIRESTAQFSMMKISREWDVPWKGKTLEMGAGGVGCPELLQKGGLDPDRFGSVHIAFGLERFALAKLNLDDARKLWRPPYVP